MMRLRRRAALLGALSLLASAATAHAECTWVLWGDHYPSPPKLSRCNGSVTSSIPTYAACWDRITELTSDLVLQPGGWTDTFQRQLGNGQYRSGAFASRVGDKVVVDLNGQTTHWTCYPETGTRRVRKVAGS
jgi:hypothetical protein